MLHSSKMLLVFGIFILFSGYVSCQVSTFCRSPISCSIEENNTFKICHISDWEGAWISEINPVGDTANQECVEGTTFGRVGGKIWVTKDCHGEFNICTTGMYNYGLGKCFTPFHCNGAVKKRCSVGPRKKTFVTTVAVREQPDTSRCNSNTVRRNGNSIFVDKECNGVFTVCFANEKDVEYTTKKCKGNCVIDNAGIITSIDVIKVYKGLKACRKLEIDDLSGVIFLGKCEADIKVGYVPEKYKITCSSEDNQNITCTDGRSMPASFYLEKEFSDGLCQRRVTFGPLSKTGPEIWVSGGCSATFKAYT